MDEAFPPGGLEKLFAQYDTIVSHDVQNTPKPSPIEPNPSPSNRPPKDEPPWWSPDEMDESAAPPLDKKELAEQALKQNLGYAPEKSWRDAEADRMEAAQKKIDAKANLAERARLANERIEERLRHPNGASFAQDEEGLNKAYNDETAKGVYYDPDTRTEYVKGSVTGRDWWDDLTKIPAWGDTRKAERYEQANKAYNDLVESGKPIDRIVGHSLGGRVPLQMQKDHFVPQSRTFGAPVLDLKPFHRFYNKAERYRHPLDPVSIFDRGATWGGFKPYSHTYTGFS